MSRKILKRSLTLGALMAFVITGSAFAEVDRTTDKYVQLGSENNKTVSANEIKTENDKVDGYGFVNDLGYINGGGERVLGGYRVLDSSLDVKKAINTNVTVNNGYFNMVVGGNYSDTFPIMSVASTEVVINDGTIKQLIAGTGFSGIDANDNAEGRTTSLLIQGGSFGGEKDNTNCPEMHVVGGDLLKTSAYVQNISSKIEETNVVINGGTFNAAVYGGSVASRNYGGCTGGEIRASVGTANIKITGGTFNDAVVAGGLAFGYNTGSQVDNAVLNIEGGTFEKYADIYAGGMIDGYGNNESNEWQNNGYTWTYGEDGTEKDGAIVKQTTININGVTVQNIYGTDGYIEPSKIGSGWLDGDGTYNWIYSQYRGENKGQAVNTTLTLTNVQAKTVDVPLGTVTIGVENKGNTSISMLSLGDEVGLAITVDGETNDAINGEASKIATAKYITIGNEEDVVDKVTTVTLEAGEATDTIILTSDGEGGFNKEVIKNEDNTGISDISSVALMAWRAETNDMNKRLGELRNANGEHGVWVRMVRGESEYNSVKNQYNQYQLGYDKKLSVDKSWTVGMALSYTDAESSFGKGSGENTHKGLAIYGSKLNDDGSFVDLIAKYSRLEHDFDLGNAKGDYDTNGYSVSAEYGKRFQQGNGMWIEPQVELTYGQVDSATYMVGGRTVNQDAMESLVGRVGISLGKDIKQGNVYARASYLYDFEGETEARFAADASGQTFEQDLGGGWWEVGVGANINLSKATYIYADVEKTFGGEVDTNWQWNLGVRYSF